jgi:hypothetical protein
MKGSVHRQVLLSTAGILFLATPFRGSDAATQAQWQVLVGGIMGQETSLQLIDALNHSDKELRSITQSFAETASAKSVQLPIHCFYETKKTKLLRRYLPPKVAGWISSPTVYKLVNCLLPVV